MRRRSRTRTIAHYEREVGRLRGVRPTPALASVGIGAAAGFAAWLVTTGGDSDVRFAAGAIVGVGAAVMAWGANQMGARELSTEARHVVRALVKTGDVRAIGGLLDALHLPDHAAVSQARDALLVLLPQIEPDCARDLNRGHLATLSGVLLGRDAHFALAAIRALAEVGDAETAEALASIADAGHQTVRPLRAKRAVREAAQAALHDLTTRLERERNSMSLVRPVISPPDDIAARLLRPALPSAGGDMKLLPRPADVPGSARGSVD